MLVGGGASVAFRPAGDSDLELETTADDPNHRGPFPLATPALTFFRDAFPLCSLVRPKAAAAGNDNDILSREGSRDAAQSFMTDSEVERDPVPNIVTEAVRIFKPAATPPESDNEQ